MAFQDAPLVSDKNGRLRVRCIHTGTPTRPRSIQSAAGINGADTVIHRGPNPHRSDRRGDLFYVVFCGGTLSAILPSTPLRKRGESSVDKVRASSTASVIATGGSMSSCQSSSKTP